MLDRSQLPATYTDGRGFNPKGKAASDSRPSTAIEITPNPAATHGEKLGGPPPTFPL
ncbi:MAG: hypothetical protein GY880_30655 [Planctomycetaceae bacterium]|nr:hypothetical protein [Planctomycetaceae bacterium]